MTLATENGMTSLWDWTSLYTAFPEVFLAVAGMILLVMGACMTGQRTLRLMGWFVMAVLGVTFFALLNMPWDETRAFGGHFIMDGFAGYMKLLVLIGLFTTMALSIRYLEQENMARFEYPILVLLAGVGMMIMLSANSFLTLYMGLELQSLALYVLAAIRRDHVRASEAGLKYFVLGALASGMLLFGISLVYGYTGSVGYDAIGQTLMAAKAEGTVAPGAVIGMVFILVAIAFKISAVPFHMWTPDVYEGAPTSVTALFAIVPKVAAVGMMMRVLFEPFGALMPDWQQVIWALAAASMVLGAFAGLVQNNIKRLIAYSSIGNVGYALIGLAVGTAAGAGAVILYLTLYMVMTAGLFAVIMMMRRGGLALESMDDFAGLSRHSPMLAYAAAIFLFSMSGIPPMAGFFGKLMIFEAAVSAEFYVLAILGVLTSVVAAYYYLRLIKIMFFDEALDPIDADRALVKRVVIGFCVVFILGFIFLPDTLVQTSVAAANILFTATPTG
jgi:NADH-quinone oxidoreductase subunit N